MVETRLIDVDGLQALVDTLRARGFTVIGPTVRAGAIVNAPIDGVGDLPRGWGDEQDPAHYRLRPRDDEAFFGFAAGAQSAKPVFFPADELLWRGRRTDHGRGFRVDTDGGAAAASARPDGPYALLGVRSCDLSAIGIHDTVLAGRHAVDAHYARRRADAFVVAVACSDPGGTCFCVSMGTGPRPEAGRGAAFDLSLTELLDGGHRFVVEVGTDRGAELLDTIDAPPATDPDVDAAARVTESASRRMGRRLDTDGIKELLYASVDSPRWDDVASRCLSCTNCTMVCPTCFCTTVEDVSDLTGHEAERHRVWDSCFDADFSYIHGGVVRESVKSRYRQWMTHKLAAWQDQFGSSGCVGCGRCVTWCPAAIDITAEAAALRGAPGSNLPDPAPAALTGAAVPTGAGE
ncbi:MAG TPA: 4Fe-4S dicluster domain-containing protein [Ornithinibacter sp.]|nr:4Fe-4S dicluster domain-containing protein [Ornithinibacter sp.]